MRSTRPDTIYGGQLAGSIAVSLLLTAAALTFVEVDLAAVLCAGLGLVTALLLLGVAVANSGRRRLFTAFAVAGYLPVQIFLFTHFFLSRDHIRWLLLSRTYEARVLEQPSPANGDFKHVAWDGWGFGGQDTTVFLVFDPTNSLAASLGAKPPIRALGLPCRVVQVRRLQSQWYAVAFYTDIDWGHGGCT